jgi:hypothetical protein
VARDLLGVSPAETGAGAHRVHQHGVSSRLAG